MFGKFFAIMTDVISRPPFSIILSVAVNALIVLIALYACKKTSAHLISRWKQTGKEGAAALVVPMRNLVYALIFLIGGVSVLSQIPGLDKMMTSLLASSGILALVGGFAAQDALGNMVSGMMIQAFKPFKKGDIVRYVDKNITGVVEEITLRHTVIRTFENKRVLVPNGTINKEVLENANFAEDRVCNFFEVSITYESDLEHAMEVLRNTALNCSGYIDCRTEEEKQSGAPELVVRVVSFNESAIVLRAMVWSKDSAAGAQLKSDLYRAVKKAFDAESIEFGYPHVVVMKQA